MTREELLKVAKPILFNTDMVRAIQDGRKTVTRRIIKLPGKGYSLTGNTVGLPYKKGMVYLYAECKNQQNLIVSSIKCPYRANDILYVRETWGEWTGGYIYKAWNEPFPQPGCHPGTKWHPSIHMPKEAARIFLKVTDVRMERLQDITEEQAECEGGIDNRGFIHSPDNEYDNIHTAKEHYIQIWNSTVDKKEIDRYGWDANPWVWVIEFERYIEENKLFRNM